MMGCHLSPADVSNMRLVCQTIEKDRAEADFIWNMVNGTISGFHFHWYNIMVRCLLRTMRVIPSTRKGTVVSDLVENLYGINSVGDLNFIKQIPYSSMADFSKMRSAIELPLINIFVFIDTEYEGPMKGDSKAASEARKHIARTAMFFVCIHYDLSFLGYILSPQSKLNFFDKGAVKTYARTFLCNELSGYSNGCIPDPMALINNCFAGYVKSTNIDPYATIPLQHKPPEELSALHPRYQRVVGPQGQGAQKVVSNIHTSGGRASDTGSDDTLSSLNKYLVGCKQ